MRTTREMTPRCVTHAAGPQERLQIRREMRGSGSPRVPFHCPTFGTVRLFLFPFYCPFYDRHDAILIAST